MLQELDVLCVTDAKEEGGKGFFTRIGRAFPSKDEEGYNLLLNALPLNGRLILRPPLPPRDEKPYKGKR